jgi:hypothetical protein
MTKVALPCLVLLLAACGGTPDAAPPCDPAAERCTLAHDFGKSALAAGQEVDGQCFSWTLNNPTDLWVSAVELDNDGAYHHSNWFYVPDNAYVHEDGSWRCGAVHFSEIGAALLGGVLFAQSTQALKEEQRFPDGVVLRVPAWSRVIGSVHLLNPAARPVETGLRLRVRTAPTAETRVKLSPFRLSYYDLKLPPLRSSSFSGDCDLRTPYERMRKEPLRSKLYYALPHYHELGRRFELALLGGPEGGRLLVDSQPALGEPGGRAFDPPIDLGTAQGVRFRCTFENPRDREVGWGIGDQEMCVMLGFAESPVAFDATVESGAAQGEEGGVVRHSGDCGVAVFNYYPG